MDPQEARIYIAIIITAIVLGVIITFFAVSIVRQQRRNFALQRKLILAEIAALEKERARTAADLHDELGPRLSVIKFRVDYAKSGNEELEKASRQLDELIVRIREIAGDMMPAALLRKGLLTAVEEFITDAELNPTLKITLDTEPGIVIPGEKSIHLFRVIQEIVQNCLKHAQANHLSISIQQQRGRIRIFCKDDGRGFDPNKMGSQGIGLKSLQNRTEIIMGGTMRLESKPGVGTAVLIEVPLN
jgi:signal transduction histidine kinase